ncbi:trypsin-like serine protease [Roseomonas terrae]|uniref:Trypsin-like serine protease n=1 Tax=Neoroseomonas terrae TaxID=424799 RepID=A0ABS5EB86_9PROT|nr:trypsin-like serine protease [Neoroseomonas terrae]MBR0648292.1 trypsin-like serine protease [Neoroseomonas terrae]
MRSALPFAHAVSNPVRRTSVAPFQPFALLPMTGRARRMGVGTMPAAALATVLLALPGSAQVPGLGPVDTRHAVSPAEAPFDAIALIETTAGGRCTGALVAPRVVLTAAHCLVTSDAAGLVAPGEISIRLGGRTVRGTALRSGPGFNPAREEPWRADWAMITVAAPLGGGHALRMLREAPGLGMPVTLAAWQYDRPDLLMADRACRVVTVATFGTQGILVGHNCAGTVGSSGAPILVRAPGGYAVAGVQVKAALGQPLGVAVPAFTIPAP